MSYTDSAPYGLQKLRSVEMKRLAQTLVTQVIKPLRKRSVVVLERPGNVGHTGCRVDCRGHPGLRTLLGVLRQAEELSMPSGALCETGRHVAHWVISASPVA